MPLDQLASAAHYIVQPKLSPDAFKAKALPLHVILTHTPPSITKAGDINENGDEEKLEDISTAAEVGLIGNLTLLPTSFSTGSYGWKGNKRVTVELQAGDSEDGGREKVQVMLTYVPSYLDFQFQGLLGFLYKELMLPSWAASQRNPTRRARKTKRARKARRKRKLKKRKMRKSMKKSQTILKYSCALQFDTI
jgi:hypothetical protein